MRDPVSVGFKAPQQHVAYERVLRLWQEGEEMAEFTHSWLFDHLDPVGAAPDGGAPAGCLEAWTLLAALAARTSRLRLGVLVTANTLREPAVLAAMVSTVDHISGGRLDFGFGAGWYEAEHRARGLRLPPPGERLARWAEACGLIRRLCAGEEVDFEGRHYRLRGARLAPATVQRPCPPFVLGATGVRALAVVARHADVWNTAAGLPGFAARLAALRAHCEAQGRDPGTLAVSAQIPVDFAAPAAVRATAERFVAAGASHLVFELPTPWPVDALERLRREVVQRLSVDIQTQKSLLKRTDGRSGLVNPRSS
ncbi:LLM class flavin-dependent oxidoreductase [Kitasatospora indigofera]|uniref:LLM class flavin-dependent oxidoreductase n=1 Tax=Kitasatospora indigofera TaxID=67307 RepID=UPI0033B1ECE1